MYFQSDYNAIVGQVFANDNVELKGIYNEYCRFASVNLWSPQDGELNEIIAHAVENSTDPIMYQIAFNEHMDNYQNTLAIQRKIYDKANMEMYKPYKRV